MYNLTEVANEIIGYLIDNNLEPPNNVSEYDSLTARMHVYHRPTLSRHGITCTELLRAINPDYIDAVTKASNGFDYYYRIADKLGLDAANISGIPDAKFHQTCKLQITCRDCGFISELSGSSLNRRKNGCKRCSGAAKWELRLQEYLSIVESRGVRLLDPPEDTINSSAVRLSCLKCSTEFHRAFSTIIGPKYTVDCPTCVPAPIFGKLGYKSIVDGHEFDSKIESDTYKLLKNKFSVEVQVPYTKLCKSTHSFVADFVLDNVLVVEVSSFNRKHHREYFDKIELKKKIIESSGLLFQFFNSLAEVKRFLDKYDS